MAWATRTEIRLGSAPFGVGILILLEFDHAGMCSSPLALLFDSLHHSHDLGVIEPGASTLKCPSQKNAFCVRFIFLHI